MLMMGMMMIIIVMICVIRRPAIEDGGKGEKEGEGKEIRVALMFMLLTLMWYGFKKRWPYGWQLWIIEWVLLLQ